MTIETDNTEISIGTLVRSYDFDRRDRERPACFVEGMVIAIVKAGRELPAVVEANVREAGGYVPHFPPTTFDAYVIEVHRDVFNGQEVSGDGTRAGSYVRVPVNGTRTTFGGVTDHVELIRRRGGAFQAAMRSTPENLIANLRHAGTAIERIAELNRGGINVAITRLAAKSYAQELEADGWSLLDSAGACVLVYKVLGKTTRGVDRGFDFLMAGPTGTHHLHVSASEAEIAGQATTARVRVHWLGFLDRNGIGIDPELQETARREATIETRALDSDRLKAPAAGSFNVELIPNGPDRRAQEER